MGSLFGGQKTKVPASGFFALPQEYQGAFNKILGNVNSNLDNINSGMFSPLAVTPDEQRGLDMFRQGFTPTPDSLNSDISMLMNPFDNFVMDDINRAANSDYSILKQDISNAGQFGSNRQRLGANDIENTRLGTFGKFRQSQYNNILDTIFNKITPQRMQDATGLLGIGDFQRELDARQKQAPLASLTAQTGLLGSIPTEFGQFGSPATTVKTGGGLGGFLSGISNIAGTAAAVAPLFSDPSLKENIVLIGKKNGFPIYEFNYIGDPTPCIGVMADDVEKIMPEAVEMIGGYKAVHYDKIGITFIRGKNGASRLH